MNGTLLFGTLCVLLCSAPLFAAEPEPAAGYEPRVDADGWEILFDGKDLNAWDVQSDVWVINEQKELTAAKGGRNIWSKRRYCDFVLELDFKVASQKKSNSGVFFRVHNLNDPVNTGMEIQILDDAAYGVRWDAMNANGALYDLVHPSVEASHPPGEWNHYRITVNDNLVTIELNGKEIVKADLNQWVEAKKNPDGSHNKFPHPIAALPREGFIGFQNYGGVPVWLRNVKLKPLSEGKPQHTGKEPIAEVLRKVEAK